MRREVAPSVSKLLTRRNVKWDDLHRLLAKAQLRLEKGETGGYTVLAIDHNIRVKASDVFRNNFAGKINRQNTEAALGTWTSASTSGYEADQHIVRTPVRNSALREERKAKRLSDRVSLMADYNQYQHQLVANPLQAKATRLHALETRLQSEGTNEILFTNEADV